MNPAPVILIVALASRIAEALVDGRTADLIRNLRELTGSALVALSSLGETITQEDLDRWKNDSETRARFLAS